MRTALDLSKYIVSKCMKDGCPITNLQLQKILYYIQKDFLQNRTSAFDDDIEAWTFGPVVPEVYYHFCGYGAMPITATYDDVIVSFDHLEAIDRIIVDKRKLNPWDMVAETHKPGGAWEQAYQHGSGTVISQTLIKAVG